MNPLQQAIFRASVARNLAPTATSKRLPAPAPAIAPPAKTIAPPEPPTVDEWVARQREIHTPIKMWFSIEAEIETDIPRPVRIETIQRVVATYFCMQLTLLLSVRRTAAVVRPRQIAMYLAKILTPRSLPEIGRRFGNRDHTTVLHAARKMSEQIARDPAFAKEIDELAQRCRDANQ